MGVSALAVGDWDGDGDLDLAAANFGSNSVAILKNDGSGNFTLSGTVAGRQGAQGPGGRGLGRGR